MEQQNPTGKTYAVIIPAAGSSSRFETNKLVHKIKGKAIINRTLQPYLDLIENFTPIVIVTGAFRKEIESTVSSDDVLFVHNEDFNQTDMITSILVGLNKIRSHIDKIQGIFIHPADIPFVQNNDILGMISILEKSEGEIIVPSYKNKKGHPLLISKSLVKKIEKLKGNKNGLRALHVDEKDKITYYMTQNKGILIDIDYNEDIDSYSELFM